MAFVRTKKVAGGEYRQLVENYREDGRVRQRVLVHLGACPNVEDALRIWPDRLKHHERRARDHREGARLIEDGQARRWRSDYWQAGRVGYLVPNTHAPPHTPRVRELLDLLSVPPEGYMCLLSAQEGEKRAAKDERRAAVLREKLTKLRRLREEGRA